MDLNYTFFTQMLLLTLVAIVIVAAAYRWSAHRARTGDGGQRGGGAEQWVRVFGLFFLVLLASNCSNIALRQKLDRVSTQLESLQRSVDVLHRDRRGAPVPEDGPSGS